MKTLQLIDEINARVEKICNVAYLTTHPEILKEANPDVLLSLGLLIDDQAKRVGELANDLYRRGDGAAKQVPENACLRNVCDDRGR